MSIELGDRWVTAISLEGLARTAVATRQPEAAARLLGAADAVRAATGAPRSAYFVPLHDRNLAETQARLGPSAFETAWAAGHGRPRTGAGGAGAPAAGSPADRPDGLTARELEVLQLVSEGLTNAQVAERLVVSLRTVHAHLRSIYRKLDVRSRSAARDMPCSMASAAIWPQGHPDKLGNANRQYCRCRAALRFLPSMQIDRGGRSAEERSGNVVSATHLRWLAIAAVALVTVSATASGAAGGRAEAKQAAAYLSGVLSMGPLRPVREGRGEAGGRVSQRCSVAGPNSGRVRKGRGEGVRGLDEPRRDSAADLGHGTRRF